MSEKVLNGTVLDEQISLSLAEIGKACSCQDDWVVELVEYGILEPIGRRRNDWRFSSDSMPRAYAARRLQRDLGINLAGVALALDLLDEMETLQCQLRIRATVR